jgi:hypothetical protein
MRIGSSILALHHALAQAIVRDLPDIQGTSRDWEAWKRLTKDQQAIAIKNRQEPTKCYTRRPMDDELSVQMWPQTWGSTALGYGGMGGAAVTDAYTVIVSHKHVHCVYFGERELAYQIDESQLTEKGLDIWKHDVTHRQIVSKSRARERYESTKQENLL